MSFGWGKHELQIIEQEKAKKAKGKLPAPTEHQEQVKLVQYVKAHGAIPGMNTFHATPNGGKLPYTRSKSTGKIFSPQRAALVAEGLAVGYPDTGFDCARRGFHGLRLELKRSNAIPSDIKAEQREWAEKLRKEGYAVFFCKGGDHAISYVDWYFGLTETMPELWGEKS